MTIQSVEILLDRAEKEQKPLWRVILEDDLQERVTGSEEESFGRMRRLWLAMKEASAGYDGHLASRSGLSGGDGAKMRATAARGATIGGPFLADIIAEALKMGESNACMKRIVAAPTAGSCGVLPAVLIPVAERDAIGDDEITRALFVAAGFGGIIATRATIAGAEGGCQAEIGAASAMAAAALTSLRGGTPRMAAHACAMALKNLLGLVCDPVAGLVEVPCVKRNVVGAVNAVACADMALAGIESKIPPDEVIDAMRDIGSMIPAALRETSEGGLAKTPTGVAFAEKIRSGGKS